ncbi:MAG: S1 RNA-binding domain-containing protein [Desulfobacterales bacterium]
MTGKRSGFLYEAAGTGSLDNGGGKYSVGTRVNGKVVSLTDYGAFVEVEEGIEGLITFLKCPGPESASPVQSRVRR